MTKRILPLLLLITFVLSIGLTGCKSAEEKACANLFKIYDKEAGDNKEMRKAMKLDDEEAYMKECLSDTEKRKDKCKDYDGALSCIAEASDEKGIGECAKKCK